MKATLSRLWTDSVAYVALLTGAGLSIAGNVVDVQRVRGASMDNLDVVMAVTFPALVVLMVEVFVNARWRGLAWYMQLLRWLGCAGVTAVAMRVSWVHLNDLMLSRGQTADVAILAPLAIDFLAIMATALILAGRGRAPIELELEPRRTLVDSMSDAELEQTLERWSVEQQQERTFSASEVGAVIEAQQQELLAGLPIAPAKRAGRATTEAQEKAVRALTEIDPPDVKAIVETHGVSTAWIRPYAKALRILADNPAHVFPDGKVDGKVLRPDLLAILEYAANERRKL